MTWMRFIRIRQDVRNNKKETTIAKRIHIKRKIYTRRWINFSNNLHQHYRCFQDYSDTIYRQTDIIGDEILQITSSLWIKSRHQKQIQQSKNHQKLKPTLLSLQSEVRLQGGSSYCSSWVWFSEYFFVKFKTTMVIREADAIWWQIINGQGESQTAKLF